MLLHLRGCLAYTRVDSTQERPRLLSWPPSAPPVIDKTLDRTTLSFFNQSKIASVSLPADRSHIEIDESTNTASYDYSDRSSIAHFPSFSFNVLSLTPLSTLSRPGKDPQKVNVLLAILEVDGPDTIRIKKGPEAGKDVSILKMILGDEDGNICKLTAWRDVAEVWGGAWEAPAVKRGDVVFIARVSFFYSSHTLVLIVLFTVDVTTNFETGASLSLTASPYNKPRLQVCYRTMPYTHEDRRLRPDLRLARIDIAMRKVAAVVAWFEKMAGLQPAVK